MRTLLNLPRPTDGRWQMADGDVRHVRHVRHSAIRHPPSAIRHPFRTYALILAVLLLLAAAPPPDIALTDETGRAVHFYADVAKDKTVAVNFIFTSCSTICQPMSGTFAKAETLLGKRNARLVSVSIDPETDTPKKLADWKKRFRGGASWTLLTGPQEEVEKLQKALGVFTPDRINHTPMVVVFNETSGKTTRVNGLTSPQAIIDAIDSVTPTSEDRGRAMYMNGPQSDITIGDNTMSSVAMACAGCHSADGRGKTEGGVAAPAITADALLHASPSRKREAYDPRHLIRAITLGFDSTGNPLAPSMPRYHLMRNDANDLVAFLLRLGTTAEPGLSDDTIRIGVLTPAASREAIVAWAERVNQRGGIYARRVEVSFDTNDVFVAIGGGAAGDVPVIAIDDPQRATRVVEETLRRAGGGVTRATFMETMDAILRRER
jgi:cytochrome oxidase Cu insertion factor (SCO1/SenC/PrrC family)